MFAGISMDCVVCSNTIHELMQFVALGIKKGGFADLISGAQPGVLADVKRRTVMDFYRPHPRFL
jgi:hypothetical protein